MTDAGWTEKVVEPYQCGPCRGKIHIEEVVRLLAKEHTHAIRIVKRLKKQAHLDEFSMSADQLDAYLEALNDVLTALQRGRGGVNYVHGRLC
mgnify:CR=1 FL=1